MDTVQVGDRVRIHFSRVRELTAAAGKSPGRRMLEFTVGTRDILPTISLGVVGMVQGQHKRFILQPGEAFGPALPKLIKEIPRQRFPKHLMLKVGKRLTATRRMSGQRRRVTVIEVRPKSIIVDGNHPLAGKVVELEVTLIALRSPSADSRDKNCFDVGGEG